MPQLSRYRLLWALLLGMALVLSLGRGSSQAACGPGNLSEACSANYGLAGNLSAVGSGTSTVLPAVDKPQLPMAGPLFYTDYLALEEQARTLLERNLGFREDISPYRGTNNFNDLVRQFDTNSGFAAAYDDPDPLIGVMTLQERINIADAELLLARDLYAFLAVYAPEARMRAEYQSTFCAHAEDPNPPDPQHSGQVLDPVIDWCDFGARLRQSVREAAYLRMIFAQQFMVDALGLHFSGSALIGGEAFVRQEVAKLRAAHHQFIVAEKGMVEALERALGNGCYIADFYTQPEWALLTRIAQGKAEAQYHIATRLSYLDINTESDIPSVQSNALTAFSDSATENYITLIGTAGMNAVAQSSPGCAKGTRPDSALVAEMALTMLNTRDKAREMAEGRNIFGYDVRFTPSRPYHTAFGSTDKGLWEQAQEAANLALQLQQQTENAERTFDLNQQDLIKAVVATNNKVDNEIQIEVGCDLQGFATDEEWYACIDEMIENTTACDPTSDTFDACMDQTTDGQPPKPDGSNWLILVSDMRTARQELRVAWLGVEAAIQKRDNLLGRASTETMRNTQVKSAIFTGAQANSGFEAAIAAGHFVQVGWDGGSFELTFDPGALIEAALRPGQIMVQAAHDMEIEDANSDAVIRNFFFDMAEAQGEIDIAIQQYNAILTTFNGVVGQTLHDVYQSKREHAYTVALPANDPSYRMVRDSRRLELAGQLDIAARLAYLAARRAEYEYTARLSSSNFRISDIYKARTANDILIFLQNLDAAIANLPGSVKDAESAQADLTISVAHHLLGLSDQYLRGQGIADANLAAERAALFRHWAADHTVMGSDGKPTLVFTFTLSADTNGIMRQVVQQGYDFYWLHKVAGISQPKSTSTGLGLNIQTAQPGELGYRQVRVSQEGQVALTSFAGCLFDYRLIPPAVLMGLDFPNTQPTDVVSGAFNGDVNGVHGNTTPGYSTPAFLGRPLTGNGWQVVIFTASPDGILPDLDLQQLTDIELKISTTHATRSSNVRPQPSQCVRTDY